MRIFSSYNATAHLFFKFKGKGFSRRTLSSTSLITMSVESHDNDKVSKIVDSQPNVTIFLRPIAPPGALGLAGFAGSTWITASWIAAWWGSPDSPTVFFPFITFWGGLSQFIAGLHGYAARDALVTVINTMWGAFWMSTGLLYLLVVSSIPLRTLFAKLAKAITVAVLTCLLDCRRPSGA